VFVPTFSLRELVGLAASVVLLAAIVIPSVRQARKQAGVQLCQSRAGQIGTSLMTYANDSEGWLPIASDRPGRWLPGDVKDQPATSNSAGLFRLVNCRYASPVAFQCPATGGRDFVVQAGMVDFPAADCVSYSYQYSMVPHAVFLREPAVAGEAARMAILADSTPLFPEGRFRRDRLSASGSDNHRGRGQNVLFLDMHAEWARSPSVGVAGNNIFLADGISDYRGNETPASRTDTFLLPAYSGDRK